MKATLGLTLACLNMKKYSKWMAKMAFLLCLPVSFSRREKQENHQLCWWLTRLLASIYFSQYNLIVQVRQ
ncbi:IS5/IS1182 family transposase, partial [Streptococcus canis]|nr:IS5/IS1182 family transposase [Streptococcus canis]